MSQAESNLADTNSSKELNIMKDFYRQKKKKERRKEVIVGQKWIGLLQVSFPLGDGGGPSGRLPN